MSLKANLGRRGFLNALTSAGAAGALGFGRELLAAEPPPETTRIRIARVQNNCWAPQYMGEDLLRGEGFSNLEYVRLDNSAEMTDFRFLNELKKELKA